MRSFSARPRRWTDVNGFSEEFGGTAVRDESGRGVVDKPGQQQETLTDILTSLHDSGDELTDAVLMSTRLKLYAGIEYLR
jgi:hypothetical protein